jgi:hypothetical protein
MGNLSGADRGGDKAVSVAVPAAGEQVDLRGAVSWVARNFEKVVQEDERGRVLLRWELAGELPPSDVARSYMRVAAQKPIEFFTRTVPKFLGEVEEEALAGYEHDRKLVSQVRGILRKYVEASVAGKQAEELEAGRLKREKRVALAERKAKREKYDAAPWKKGEGDNKVAAGSDNTVAAEVLDGPRSGAGAAGS